MRAISMILLLLAFNTLARADLVGKWTLRDAQMEVIAEFRADGTFTRTTRNAFGAETVEGSYQLRNDSLILQPKGANETITLHLRYPDTNTLELRGDDGSTVQMIRQNAAQVNDQKNPLDQGDHQRKPVNASAPVTFGVHHYIDKGGLRDRQTGDWLEGFCVLVPRGWNFTGGFRWVAAEKPATMITKTDLLNPVKSDYLIASPDGQCYFRQYPVEYWCAIDTFPPGHNYNGMIVAPALTPEQYITQFIIPRQRGGQLADVQLVKQEPLGSLAEKYTEESRRFDAMTSGAVPNTSLTFKAGGVTIDYTENGIAYRERFICILQYLQTANMIMWQQRSNFSVRAPREQFDRMTQTFATIATSIQTNPRWSIALIELRQKIEIPLQQAEAYCNRIRNEIAQSHAQTTHELARDSGYLTGDYYPYKGLDGNRYTLPTDKYHFMNQAGEILSQDSHVPPSSDWTSIEPYNQ